MKRHLIGALVLALACLPALAQRQKTTVPELDDDSRKGEMARLAEKKAEERFDAADENRDGGISKDEAGRHEKFIAENFARYDKNADGKLTWEEFVGHDRWKRQAKPAK